MDTLVGMMKLNHRMTFVWCNGQRCFCGSGKGTSNQTNFASRFSWQDLTQVQFRIGHSVTDCRGVVLDSIVSIRCFCRSISVTWSFRGISKRSFIFRGPMWLTDFRGVVQWSYALRSLRWGGGCPQNWWQNWFQICFIFTPIWGRFPF